MSEHETFQFRTVDDMHAVPLEKIEHFCRDLELWLSMHKMIEAVDCEALKVTSPRDVFGWIDDGKHDANITIKLRTEEFGSGTEPPKAKRAKATRRSEAP